YWNAFVAGLTKLLPTQQNILEQLPILEASNVTITVNTDAEAVSLKKRIEHEFRDFCRQAGIGNYVLSFKVETKKSKLGAGPKRTVLEDQEFGRHAQKQQHENQTKQAEEKSAKENLTIGYPIKDEPVKMETILDEERKLTVQGFVFLKDVRELRSGRSEEHTSELQSRFDLVCRLLLEK